MTRTRNTIRNVMVSFGFQAVSIITNFVIRTVMIRQIGMQAVSLNGLFTEVLSALSLAELGIGSSIVYNLYKPLAEGDKKKVCQLMQLFKTAYHVIAAVTFLIGLGLCPWIHLLVNSVDYSLWDIRLVYMLFISELSISYLFSYKSSLLMADQKNYISSQINMVSRLVGLVMKVCVLIMTRSFVVYLVTSIIVTVLGNLLLSYVVQKVYPWMEKPGSGIDREEKKVIFSNVKNIFIKSLSGKITNSTDNMLISVLVNTLQVGIYSNYALIMGIFRQITNQIAYGGLSASLGNLLVTEKNEKSVKVFERLTYLFYVIASLACVGVYCSVSAFITAWLGDGFLMSRSVVFVCCFNLYMEIVTRPLWSIMEVSGLFKQDKNVSIIGSTVNLVLSVFLGLRIGIAGIFIGTSATYILQTILKSRLLFHQRLETTAVRYYCMMVVMLLGTMLQLMIASSLCGYVSLGNPLFQFVVKGMISFLVVAGSIVLCTWRTDNFRYFWDLLQSVVSRRTVKSK